MASEERSIVVDTNVLISSLINPDSVVWKVLDIESINFLVPEIAIDELEKYEELIKDKLKSKGRKEEYEYLLSELFTPIVVVPSSIYMGKIKDAYKVMRDIDEKDTEFLAVAMLYGCPVWSDDADFQNQQEVKVYTSEEVIKKIL